MDIWRFFTGHTKRKLGKVQSDRTARLFFSVYNIEN